MSDIVNLHSSPIDLDSELGRAFVVDCTRAGEGLFSDLELQQKYELSPADWIAITKDTALERAVRAESERRMLNGVALQESAAKHAVKGPTILAGIMTNEAANPRHRIDSFQALRQTAIGRGDDRPATSDKFVIRIDLTADGGGEVIQHEFTDFKPIPLEGKSDGE